MSNIDLSEIPTNVIRNALCETIEKRVKSKNYDAKVTSASKAGESNFVGIVHRVTFNKNDEKQQEKFILKVAPQNEARRAQFHSRDLFLQEICAYNEVNYYFFFAF